MDALYFRVSSERQTTQNQFDDLLHVAEKDGSGRDWNRIMELISRCVIEEHRTGTNGTTRTVYRLDVRLAADLARECVYVEQGRSGKIGARRRPLFEQMKRDAAARKFDRLLVWKVSRLGRDMREVIATVYELADLGITVIPVKSATGPINSTMGKLLWAIQAWYAEMENSEKSEAIKAGQARARAEGKHMGRPKAVFDRDDVVRLRDREHLSWPEIARRTGAGVGTVVRAYRDRRGTPHPFQKYEEAVPRASLNRKGLPSHRMPFEKWMVLTRRRTAPVPTLGGIPARCRRSIRCWMPERRRPVVASERGASDPHSPLANRSGIWRRMPPSRPGSSSGSIGRSAQPIRGASARS